MRPTEGAVRSAPSEKRRIELAKWIDRWLGGLLVRTLSLLHRPRLSRRIGGPVRRILFIKLWGMGSVVLCEPALRWLKRRHPQAEIHFLTLTANRPMLDLIPAVSEIYSIPFENLHQLAWQGARLLAKLRRDGYDLVFDAEFLANFPALIARFTARSESGRVVGFSSRSSSKQGIQDECVELDAKSHMATEFLRLACAGEPVDHRDARPRITLPVQPVDRNLIEPLSGRSFQPFLRQYVALNVNASLLAVERRWPRDRFVHVANHLLHVYDLDLVLIGSGPERDYVESVEREVGFPKRVWNFCGGLDIPGLAFLLSRARLLISNDSGPIHLAAALDVPLVGFYGPETPLRYGPLSQRKLVFYRNLWCSPCMHAENAKTVRCVNSLSCMRSIEPAHASAQIQRFIEKFALAARRRVEREPREAPDEAFG